MLRCALLLVLPFVLSCDTSTGPGGLQLDLAVAPRVVRAHEAATIILTVSNPTPRAVTVNGSSSCTFTFRILEVTERRACTADLRGWDFAPGASRAFEFSWSGWFRDSLDREVRLPAGVYTLRGVLDASQGQGRSQDVAVELVDW